jgi:uncharacterized Fe-S center protein
VKKKALCILSAILCLSLLAGCGDGAGSSVLPSAPESVASVPESNIPAPEPESVEAPESSAESAQEESPAPGVPAVYYTADISPAGLMAAYEALGRTAQGENVAVKISTGEPGGNHFLAPGLIGDFVQSVDGTIVECNTAYGGKRASTAMHYQVAEDHGFTAIADVVIMDEEASMTLPVIGGTRLTENLVGARFEEFDFHVVLSHFKGHSMGGFGGALKNLSIGYASSQGKLAIHGGGDARVGFRAEQDAFLEAMAEAAKSVVDAAGDNILYISVMNHLSVDCDCSSNPATPTMGDIAILASLDPVALDQACVDLVYAAPDGQDLVERIESRHGIHTVEHAAAIGLGSREYELVNLDA